MRTIIAGSRERITYLDLLKAVNELPWKISLVLSGTARGADLLGERWAKEKDITIEKYPADWDKLGKSAGYIRNALMAENAEALLALWDGKSKGTQHMINLAKKQELKVYIMDVSKEDLFFEW